jgi:MCP family monocarboxylic acid transporter-like MFS transporter 10
MAPMTILSGVLSLALWLPSNSNVAIIVYAILYGFFSGAYVSLLPAFIARITPQPIYGARLGAIYMIVAIANLVGTPTGGGIVQGGQIEDFENLIIFTGVMVTIGGLLLVAAWWLEVKAVLEQQTRAGKEKSSVTWKSFRF